MLWHIPLTMRDGVRLDANVYLPENDTESGFPVIMASNPYSKDAWFGPRTNPHLVRFVEAGYAVAVVDFRGTGASEGTKADAFERVEQDDVYDTIMRLAEQDWCDGRVAAWGLSYGGITALRAAVGDPPPLRAVVAIEGSTDPYSYEVARRGAVGLAMITAEWSTMLLALTSLPPASPWLDPAAFRARVNAVEPWHDAWARHPRRDAYWQGREVDPASITVPTLIFTGWRDPNVVGAWRDFAAINAPSRVVCGPWPHGMPEDQEREPVDSVAMAIDWFDQHVRRSRPPEPDIPAVATYVLGAGTWEFSERFPAEPPTDRPLYLTRDTLTSEPATEPDTVPVAFDPTVGVAAGFGLAAAPGDRRRDEERSTVFVSDVGSGLDIAGTPWLDLWLTAPHRDVDVVAKIHDIAPDGASELVSRTFRRLSNPPPYTADPEDSVTPPRTSRVAVEFEPIRYHLKPGHRLQLVLSAADFPEYWPLPSGAGYEVHTGGDDGSVLHLPTVTTGSSAARAGRPPVVEHRPENPLLADSAAVTVDADTSDVVVRGHLTSHGHTMEGEPTRLAHTYEISANADDASATLLRTHTTITAGAEDRRRTAQASCVVGPRESHASLEVSGGGFDVRRQFQGGVEEEPE